MDIKTQFSFLKLFNTIKGVGRPAKEGEADVNYLEKRASKKEREKFEKFFKWCDSEGIIHPKIKYPVMFGSGDNQYPGCMAIEDIGKNEPFIKVPSRLIISTQAAMLCEPLQKIFYEHPQVFGKHVSLGEDNVLDAYILYQFSLGQASPHYQQFQCWPEEPDILMNWEDEDLEFLQDPTLIEDAEKGQDEFYTQWEQLYSVLSQYPDLYKERDIMMDKFKYAYIVTTNRAFSSNWPGVSLMVPYADYLNHENVDTTFDCVDQFGLSLGIKEEGKKTAEEQAHEQKSSQRKRDFLNNMRTDLLELETKILNKMEAEGHCEQTEEAKQDKEVSLKLMQMTLKNVEAQRLEENQEEEERKNQSEYEQNGYCSSGLESDNDLDLLVEQEALRNNCHRVKSRKFAEMGETNTGKEEIEMSKDMAKAVWDQVINNMPQDFTFVLQTGQDAFPKGSQVFLCYGRMTNREMLKRYGFCITNNKYNNMFIKLRLEVSDPDFKYRLFILQKFFSLEADKIRGGVNVSSRHFKVHYHYFNMKVLKFIKILSFNVKEDDISCIVETRSLSLEYISLQKLQKVYQDFLDQFPTTLQQDMADLRDPVKLASLTVRQHAAYTYRSEQKRIMINQIKLVKILLHMIERLMRGMTLDFSVLRVFELETKKEFPVNRLMIDNYLSSLKRGMKKNEDDYFKVRGMDPVKGKQLMMETQKQMKQDMSRVLYRQFEVKGYEKMIERIMAQPLQSSAQNNNHVLQQRLLTIQEQLKKQSEKNRVIERQTEKYVTENVFQQELREAIDRKKQNFEQYLGKGAAPQVEAANTLQDPSAAATEAGSIVTTEEVKSQEKRDSSEGDDNSASSYYDSEYESEQEESESSKDGPKTEEIIDLTGNYSEKAEELKKNAINTVSEEDLPKNPYDSSTLFKRMKQEWETLQTNPSAMDDQIKAQLEMLEQINNNAFNEKGGETETNQTEIGKLMQAMMKKQKEGVNKQSLPIAEYKSRGEPFMDP